MDNMNIVSILSMHNMHSSEPFSLTPPPGFFHIQLSCVLARSSVGTVLSSSSPTTPLVIVLATLE